MCTRDVCTPAQTRHASTVYRGCIDMRFIHLFLAGYVVLVIGVALGLWQSGVLSRVAPVWIGAGLLVAIGLGIMMSVASGKPTTIEKVQP